MQRVNLYSTEKDKPATTLMFTGYLYSPLRKDTYNIHYTLSVVGKSAQGYCSHIRSAPITHLTNQDLESCLVRALSHQICAEFAASFQTFLSALALSFCRFSCDCLFQTPTHFLIILIIKCHLYLFFLRQFESLLPSNVPVSFREDAI